jgi:hypothetical protein
MEGKLGKLGKLNGFEFFFSCFKRDNSDVLSHLKRVRVNFYRLGLF